MAVRTSWKGHVYVKKEKIDRLWPLMAAPERLDHDIRKFEEFGTHPVANFLAIAEALTFHEGIGPKRKEARMKYLNDYWIDQLIDSDWVRLHTAENLNLPAGLPRYRSKG